MNKEIVTYNNNQELDRKAICDVLAAEIHKHLPEHENKLWHGAPVWFSDGNPIVGYAVRKNSVQLLFWSGQSFDEPGLTNEGSFKAAEAHYTNEDEINKEDVARWIDKATKIQWDYKNIVKRKGVLERLS